MLCLKVRARPINHDPSWHHSLSSPFLISFPNIFLLSHLLCIRRLLAAVIRLYWNWEVPRCLKDFLPFLSILPLGAWCLHFPSFSLAIPFLAPRLCSPSPPFVMSAGGLSVRLGSLARASQSTPSIAGCPRLVPTKSSLATDTSSLSIFNLRPCLLREP